MKAMNPANGPFFAILRCSSVNFNFNKMMQAVLRGKCVGLMGLFCPKIAKLFLNLTGWNFLKHHETWREFP